MQFYLSYNFVLVPSALSEISGFMCGLMQSRRSVVSGIGFFLWCVCVWRLELREQAGSKRAVDHACNGAMNLDVRTDQIKSLELVGYSLLLLLVLFDRPWRNWKS